jgi:cleavage and polyadenylation specificity factor subunit 3
MPTAIQGIAVLMVFALAYIGQLLLGSPKTLREPNHALSPQMPSLYAMADIHGDFSRATKALQHAGVLNGLEWALPAGSRFVQTGDIVDRGRDTLRLYAFMRNLTVQAEAAGGQVFKLWGNHEYMNALLDWRYVDGGDYATWPSREARVASFSSGGDIFEDWMIDYEVTYRDPVYRVHFMHAGLHPDYRAFDRVDSVGRAFMRRAGDGHRSHAEWTTEELEFWSSDGPMWFRGWAAEDEAQACFEAKRTMAKLDVDFLVVGHTPNFEGVVARCGGHVILLDTGMSAAYGGPAVVLEFKTVADASGKAKVELVLHYDDDKSREIVVVS